MTINDGGPAFPRTGACGHTQPQSGMSLRDWFAGQALAGAMACSDNPVTSAEQAMFIAVEAYLVADAMLKARKEKQ